MIRFSSFAITISLIFTFYSSNLFSQGCCSGGSGSPIAGGTSQGVLLDRQMEIATNYQYIGTNKFLYKNSDTAAQFDWFYSNYIYTRLAYGVSKNLTMSIESGYFINKTQFGLDGIDTISSSGIADLIIFPRYDVLNLTEETKRTEITIGLGYKIPLGMHNDSTVSYVNPYNGNISYTTSPPIVQATTGSQDVIFYAFFYRGYPLKKFRIFANALYVKKGWNSLGEKFGDYASIGIFVGKTIFEKLGLTAQIKAEWIDKMQSDKNVDLMAFYNVDINSSGSKKILFVPQISYSIKKFTVYALSEIPIYQYVNNIQVASQYQLTVGLSYRFMTNKPETK